MILFTLTAKSFWNRRGTIALMLCSLALSIVLLLGITRLRAAAFQSFTNTISGTDLLVGARTTPVQLLLFSLFHLGSPTNNVSWESYEHFRNLDGVKWAVPLSVGDSHRGFRVVGTNAAFFMHYRYGQGHELRFAEGKAFADDTQAVLGAAAARELGYTLGSSFVLSHGLEAQGAHQHDDHPFSVAGILAATGTPIDKAIFVDLSGIQAIHAGWEDGAPPAHGHTHHHDHDGEHDHPEQISAFLLGLQRRGAALHMQRTINEYAAEPLTAAIPARTLQELWGMFSIAQQTLTLIAACVVVASLSGMLVSLLATLGERRREMAILRSVGAKPVHIFGLLLTESVCLSLAGCTLGATMLFGISALARTWLQRNFGIEVPITALSPEEWLLLGGVLLAGVIAGLLPAWRAYRTTLADGLTMRF